MNHPETAIERPCPSCGEAITLAPAEQVAGTRVRCLHCNVEALVEREWDAKLGVHHWTLEDPEEDLPAERI